MYLRKDDAFQVQLPTLSTPIVVAPNSAEIWIGGTQGFFSKKTFYKDGQFYVPFDEFFKAIHYSVTREKTGFVIRSGGLNRASIAPAVPPPPNVATEAAKRQPLVPSSTMKAKSTPPIVAATPSVSMAKDNAVIMTTRAQETKGDVDLPVMPTGQPLAIAFGAKVYPLAGRFMMQKDTVYADLESILVKEGVQVVKRADAVELIVGGRTYRFFTQVNDVRMTSGNQTEYRNVGWPLIIQNGTPYLSIKALATALNYGISWDRQSRRIQLVNRLQQVSIIRKGGVLKVVLSASRPLIALPPVSVDKDGGFSVDLLDVQLGCLPGHVDSNDPIVSRLEVRSISDTRVRLKVMMKPTVGFSPVLPLSTGGEMILSNRITSISEFATHNEWIVRVSGIGSFVPKVWRIPSPSTALVVDIDNSYSMLPMVIRAPTHSPYQMIRTSQFKIDPASTRIVLDMVSTAPYAVRSVSPSVFDIVFPMRVGDLGAPTLNTPIPTRDMRVSSSAIVKGLSAAPVPVHTRREPTLQKPSHHRPLYRKIIVVDPGHGGNDPGAIAANGSYEKALTIDISNRLKALLEEAGATVIMCRQRDENPSLQDRCDVANFNNADLLLSIHINSFFHPFASGSETYYYKPTDKPLAFYVHQEIVKALGFRDNGLKRARLYVLRNTRMPAMLVEPGFITNPLEYGRMAEPETRQKIAKAVADGTVRYMAEYGGK